jgi:hypothetical protein
MTGPAAPHGMTSTLPPLSGLVAGFAVLIVAVIFITQNARAHHIEPSRWGRTDRQDHEAASVPGPHSAGCRHARNRGTASLLPIPLPVHPPRQMTHEKG